MTPRDCAKSCPVCFVYRETNQGEPVEKKPIKPPETVAEKEERLRKLAFPNGCAGPVADYIAFLKALAVPPAG